MFSDYRLHSGRETGREQLDSLQIGGGIHLIGKEEVACILQTSDHRLFRYRSRIVELK